MQSSSIWVAGLTASGLEVLGQGLLRLQGLGLSGFRPKYMATWFESSGFRAEMAYYIFKNMRRVSEAVPTARLKPRFKELNRRVPAASPCANLL